jgi:hypothetical protein
MFLDVIKTGSRYQVVDTRDNSPVGRTYATRHDAWEHIHTLDSQAIAALGQGKGKDSIEKALEALKPAFDDVFGTGDLNKPKVSPPKQDSTQTKS